jgi:serine-type D-Ala-D-Ala carboxypeptidase (penicillin-binding protein 5/6)
MPGPFVHVGRRRRSAPRIAALLLGLVILVAAGLGAARSDGGTSGPGSAAVPGDARVDASPAGGGPGREARDVRVIDPGTAAPALGVDLAAGPDPLKLRFGRQPRAGMLFDVNTGEVLWRREATRVVPVASLTKMMTALLVVEGTRPTDKVRITRESLAYSGSGVGVLPRGKRVKVETMLHGLMLPSGNDAAIALAQSVSGTVPAFVDRMNDRAAQMGLSCTRFRSPDGLDDRGRSCARDQAALAMAVLRNRRLARVVRRRQAILPFPIKGGRLHLYNNNPLLRLRYPGANGLKTGYTRAAGQCLVATATRGDVTLGVVLLGSPDTAGQARKLLDRGFKLRGVRAGDA